MPWLLSMVVTVACLPVILKGKMLLLQLMQKNVVKVVQAVVKTGLKMIVENRKGVFRTPPRGDGLAQTHGETGTISGMKSTIGKANGDVTVGTTGARHGPGHEETATTCRTTTTEMTKKLESGTQTPGPRHGARNKMGKAIGAAAAGENLFGAETVAELTELRRQMVETAPGETTTDRTDIVIKRLSGVDGSTSPTTTGAIRAPTPAMRAGGPVRGGLPRS